MPSLRQRLQSESPELHAALLRSWEIAQNEWLPAIAPSEGSFNSQPHFSHIEQHLEALLGPAAESAATKLQLTGLEVYLLLAGVLFHDLGRVHGEADHAFASARDLQDHFAALGIPNFELASSLARIARYHDPRKNVDGEAGGAGAERVKRTLRDIRLEPYGVARELYVATLLALADHMDGSYRRALPRYVAPDDVVGFKGAFRRLVSGTGYDPATCTLKTCLNGFAEASDRKPGAFAYGKTYRHFQRALHTPPDFHWGPIPKVDRQPAKGGKPCDLWRELLRICCPDLTGSAPSRMFRRSLAAATTRAFILRRTPGGAGKAGAPAGQAIWPADYLLARVLNDLRVNREFLKTVQEDLREMGLPVDDWFVEFDSEVYDASGTRDSEPMLPSEFLVQIAREAWNLNERLIGNRALSYEVLADSLRMENIALVRVAMRRIVKRAQRSAKTRGLLFAGASGWHWNVPEGGLSQEKGLRLVLEVIAGVSR